MVSAAWQARAAGEGGAPRGQGAASQTWKRFSKPSPPLHLREDDVGARCVRRIRRYLCRLSLCIFSSAPADSADGGLRFLSRLPGPHESPNCWFGGKTREEISPSRRPKPTSNRIPTKIKTASIAGSIAVLSSDYPLYTERRVIWLVAPSLQPHCTHGFT